MDDEYVTVRIPKILAEQIDKIVEKKISGYTSRAEFVKEAIRRRLEEMQKPKDK